MSGPITGYLTADQAPATAPSNVGSGIAHANAEMFGSTVDGDLVSLRVSATGELSVVAGLPAGAATENTLQAVDAKLAGTLAVGLPTDAARDSTLGTMSAKLPATLGQAPMAASMSVVVASDQSAVPVSGSVTVIGSALPAGAATETTLQAVDTKLGGTLTVGLPAGAAAETTLALLSAKLPAALGSQTAANSLSVTLDSDSGGLATQSTLEAISAKLPAALGSQTAANSLSVVIASDGGGSEVSIASGHGLALESAQQKLLAAAGFVGGSSCISYPFATTFTNGTGWRIPNSGANLAAPTTLASLYKPPTDGTPVVWFLLSNSLADVGRSVTFDAVMLDGTRSVQTVVMTTSGANAVANLPSSPGVAWVNHANAAVNEAGLVPGATAPLAGTNISVRTLVGATETVIYNWTGGADSATDTLVGVGAPQWPIVAVPAGYAGYLQNLRLTGSDPGNFVYWGVAAVPLLASGYMAGARYLANGMQTSPDWRFPVQVPSGPLGPVAAGSLAYFAAGCSIGAPGRHHLSGQFVLVPN